ncbi:MAG: hypothetical protein HZA24_12190 [Nitrospirae bacterium]|nr:hypothetical protein [Nitrospirota bacterium]
MFIVDIYIATVAATVLALYLIGRRGLRAQSAELIALPRPVAAAAA